MFSMATMDPAKLTDAGGDDVGGGENKDAEEMIEECAAFPNGQYDDYVDSMTQAVIRFMQGGFISTYTDELDAPNFKIEKEHKYYG